MLIWVLKETNPCPRLKTMKGLKLKFIFDNNFVMSEIITETVIVLMKDKTHLTQIQGEVDLVVLSA